MNTFAKRLKYARERKELIQAQLARLIGLKFQSAVGNWESGARKQPRSIRQAG
jgi:transcriptional regulator with XRE-family HTH domain